MDNFERFRDQHTVVLTTFRRDGTAVPTPVSLAVGDDPTTGYIRTWSTAGKAKRMRNNDRVVVAPSTFRKHPILHGVLVPLGHRIQRNRTQHYELRPIDDSA